MRREYVTPELDIRSLALSVDILGVSNPESSTPEEGGNLPRTTSPEDELFG